MFSQKHYAIVAFSHLCMQLLIPEMLPFLSVYLINLFSCFKPQLRCPLCQVTFPGLSEPAKLTNMHSCVGAN